MCVDNCIGVDALIEVSRELIATLIIVFVPLFQDMYMYICKRESSNMRMIAHYRSVCLHS